MIAPAQEPVNESRRQEDGTWCYGDWGRPWWAAELTNLAPAKGYTVRVSLTNEFGSCNPQQIHSAPHSLW